MANGKSDEDKIAEEATKLERLRLKAEQDKKHNDRLEKANKKLDKLLSQAESETNVVQVVVAVGAMSVGTIIGYTLNKRLRKYTRDKKWVNDKGERSVGSIFLVDIMPPALGVAGLVGGSFIENGPLGAGIMGLGGGIATGSVLSTITSNKCTDACDDQKKA